jgi:hypothetical protein
MAIQVSKVRIAITGNILIALIAPLTASATGNGNPPAAGSALLDTVTTVFAYATMAFAAIIAILVYLQGTLKKEVERRELKKKNDALQARINAVEQGKSPVPLEQSEVEPASNVHLVRIRNQLVRARETAQEALLKVERRASLNLAIGITVSAAAIAILGVQLVEKPPVATDWPVLVATYFPKLIACVFIELLAFFFLRLYRASLLEIRTYGLDLKELTLKQVALEAAWDQTSSDAPRSKLAFDLVNSTPSQLTAEKQDLSFDPDAAIELIQKVASALAKKKSDAK